MAILAKSETRVIVQGITGLQGSFHTKLMLQYGTKIVAGTTPGKGGEFIHGVRVYNTIEDATCNHRANASVIFVPAPFAADAALEAIEAGIKMIVLITEHIPIRDTIELMNFAKQAKATVIGPNTPGIITPEKCKLGILPSKEFAAGNIGIVSRSGTLTYEIAAALTNAGIGQSTCLGIGGDPVTGLNFIDALELFRADAKTIAIILIGEIGGNLEELTANYIQDESYSKPVIAFIAGRSAPPGKRMGHAGALVMGKSSTAETKIAAFEAAGVKVAEKPSDIPKLLTQTLHKNK